MDENEIKYLKIEQCIQQLFKEGTSEEEVQHFYDMRAERYDDEVSNVLETQNQWFIAKAVLELSPGSPQSVKVLDIGAGTGLVGVELQKLGFQHIDYNDPSMGSLEVAKRKCVYKRMICSTFKNEPLDIPSNYYDIIVTAGTFIPNHLPYDCLYEMIRIVRKGGIIGIITRATSFDGVTVPEYKNIVPLIKKFETKGYLKTLRWEAPVPYMKGCDGILIIFDVLCTSMEK